MLDAPNTGTILYNNVILVQKVSDINVAVYETVYQTNFVNTQVEIVLGIDSPEFLIIDLPVQSEFDKVIGIGVPRYNITNKVLQIDPQKDIEISSISYNHVFQVLQEDAQQHIIVFHTIGYELKILRFASMGSIKSL